MIKESETNVTALFFYHRVKNEIELWRKEAKSEEEKQKNLEKSKISIRKYAKAILLCKFFLRSKSSLEIRIVGDQETYNVEEVEKETFALIRLKGMMTNVTMTSTTMTTMTSTKTSAIMTTTTMMFSIICEGHFCYTLVGGQGEAICYAETATSPQSRKFATHLISINGEEVLNKRRIYERSRANAWSNEDSIFMLANALIKENKEGFGSSAINVSY